MEVEAKSRLKWFRWQLNMPRKSGNLNKPKPVPPLQECSRGFPQARVGIKLMQMGLFFGNIGCSGVGVVIRNEKGQLMGSMSKRMMLPLGALEFEAKDVEEGIHLAWDLGLKDIIVESDSLILVNALRGLGSIPSSIRKVMEGIEMTLRQFSLWKTSHIRRGNNRAAYLLAQHARWVDECIVWEEDTPLVIGNQIQHDVTNLNIV